MPQLTPQHILENHRDLKQYGCTRSELDEIVESSIYMVMDDDMESFIASVVKESRTAFEQKNQRKGIWYLNRIEYYLGVLAYRNEVN